VFVCVFVCVCVQLIVDVSKPYADLLFLSCIVNALSFFINILCYLLCKE